jgi:hypothetical protein
LAKEIKEMPGDKQGEVYALSLGIFSEKSVKVGQTKHA